MNKTPEKGVRWQALMQEAQAGNNEAYRTLLTEVQEYAMGYCYNRLKSHAAASDTTQEILIAFHKYRHTYNPSKPFLPWLVTMMKHKVIDTVRSQVRRLPEQALDDDALQRQGTTALHDRSEAHSCVSVYLNELSDDYREVIVLTKLQGLSIAEAAKTLEISEESVKVRVHRGLKKLKQIAEKDISVMLQERL